MKIHYLSNSPLQKKPANAIHVMNMCAAFTNNGHDVVLHANSNVVDIDFHSIYGIPNSFILALKPLPKIKYIGPIINGYRQVNEITENEVLCYARCSFSAYFALKKGFKVIFEVHEMPYNYFLNALYKKIFDFDNLVKIVCISKALLFDLTKKYDISCSTQVAHDGANLPVHNLNYRLLFENNDKKIVVGYAGGLRAGNGINIILNLAKKNPNLLFVLAGGKDDEIEQWRKHDLNNVLWLGRLEPRQVTDFLQQCDILVAPYQPGPKTGAGRDTSRWMSPLKLFEYMAVKKPIMLSDFPVLREIVNEQQAKLLPPSNVDQWNEALNQLVENKQLADELANNSYEQLINEYTWDKRAALVLEGVAL